MHEHVVIGFIGHQWDPRAGFDSEAELAKLSQEFRTLRETHGVRLLVDAGPAEMGRDVIFQARLAAASGVSVVAATGYDKSGRGLPYYYQKLEQADLEDILRYELVQGVPGTGIRCGVIKLASGGGALSADELRNFRAGGRVSGELDCPIVTHTDPEGWAEGNIGLRQLEVLLEAGARPERIAIGHACGSRDLDQLIEICRLGAFVAIDRIGIGWIRPDEERADLVRALVDAGFGDNVLLSHDHQAIWNHRRRPQFGSSLAMSFSHIHDHFIPMLERGGLPATKIDMLMRANP